MDLFRTPESMERAFLFNEERGFFDRAHTDKLVGLWAAGRLGLCGKDVQRFALRAMEAGVRSADGRGGFDFIAAALTFSKVSISELRNRYTIASVQTCPVTALAA